MRGSTNNRGGFQPGSAVFIDNQIVYSYSNTNKHEVTSISLNNVTLNNYAYEADGNMVEHVIGLDKTETPVPSYKLDYDSEGRLTNVTENNNQVAAYIYDGDGKMVEKTENEVTTVYIGNLLELQLPSDVPDVTPTLPMRTATVPTRIADPTLTRTTDPTVSLTPSVTSTATSGVTRSSTSTFTSTSTSSKTFTKTTGPTPTRTLTPSKTFTPSNTSTNTGTPRTATSDFTPSFTPSQTSTKSKTATRTNTPPTSTSTITLTPTQTPSITLTPIVLTNYHDPIWRFYYYADSARIAMRIKNGDTNLVFFLFTDQLGSTNVTSDSNGLMVSLSLYMPWGGSRGGAGTTLTDYGFNGQRSMEGSIGLQYFNACWYDSSLGRWTQPDNIVPQASQGVQAWDRYEFVNNNSINHNDPTGHSYDDSADYEDDPNQAEQVRPTPTPQSTPNPPVVIPKGRGNPKITSSGPNVQANPNHTPVPPLEPCPVPPPSPSLQIDYNKKADPVDAVLDGVQAFSGGVADVTGLVGQEEVAVPAQVVDEIVGGIGFGKGVYDVFTKSDQKNLETSIMEKNLEAVLEKQFGKAVPGIGVFFNLVSFQSNVQLKVSIIFK
jgi:RHS repeat-associated protein